MSGVGFIRLCIACCTVCVVAGAGLSVAGYVFRVPALYTWYGTVGMALNTACFFLLCGIMFLLLLLLDDLRHNTWPGDE